MINTILQQRIANIFKHRELMIKYLISVFSLIIFSIQLSGQDELIEVTSISNSNGIKNIEFYAQNDNIGKFIVHVKFSRLVNLRSTSEVNDFAGTVGSGRTKIFTLRPLIPNRPIDYNYMTLSHCGFDRVKLKESIT